MESMVDANGWCFLDVGGGVCLVGSGACVVDADVGGGFGFACGVRSRAQLSFKNPLA